MTIQLLKYGVLFLTIQLSGQTGILTHEDFNKSGAIRLIYVNTKSEAMDLAKYDIEKGTPFILLQGGYAPVVYTSDSVFENRFKVHYFEQGCVGPAHEFMEAYNFVVFKYLVDNYGKKWTRSIRKDAIGLRTWKKKK